MFRTRRIFVTSILVMTLGTAPFSHTAPTSQPDYGSLVTQLADRDPRVRQAAVKQLTDAGESARQVLMQAANDDPDPQIRTQAASILTSLPLTRPGDPVTVRRRLEQYRKADAVTRQNLIRGEWAQQEGDSSVAIVLLRILTDASNEADRFLASEVLSVRRDAMTRRLIRQVDAKNSTNLPLIFTAAGAWSGRNHERADELFQRAVALAAERRLVVNPQIDAAVTHLIENEYVGQRYARLVTLLRQRLQLEENATFLVEPPTAAQQLLFVHAFHGPQSGFFTDLQTLAQRGDISPALLAFAIAGLIDQTGCHFTAEAAALLATGVSELESKFPTAEPDQHALQRMAVARMLYQAGKHAWAAREFHAIITSRPAAESDHIEASAHQQLALIAVDAHDYKLAAEHLDAAAARLTIESVLPKFDRTARRGYLTADTLRADATLQRLRAARIAGDKVEITKHLDTLLNLPMPDGDTSNELILLLRKLNRGEAQNMFDANYQLYKRMLDMDPDHPEYLNNLAWLCARSGEKPDEAVKLAEKALVTDPNNAAYLDTAAEAYFQQGNPKRAAELERKALEKRGADRFMIDQLERFERRVK